MEEKDSQRFRIFQVVEERWLTTDDMRKRDATWYREREREEKSAGDLLDYSMKRKLKSIKCQLMYKNDVWRFLWKPL